MGELPATRRFHVIKRGAEVPIDGHSPSPAAFESVIASTDKHYEQPVYKI
jgi:hypothetical protein